MLDLFVPTPLALSSATTWVTERVYFPDCFGFGEVTSLVCKMWHLGNTIGEPVAVQAFSAWGQK